MIAASVVVLPEPVAPVTRIRPRCSSASRLTPGREPQVVEARHVPRDDAERERDRAALAEDVDAEARKPVARVRDVELARVEERLELRRRDRGDALERRLEVVVRERRDPLDGAERAVATDDRRLADLEVDVARAELDGCPQGEIEVHGARPCIGRRSVCL